MDYALQKDEEMLRKSVREFFEKECPKDRVRELKTDPKAFDPKMWKKMIELGFQGLIIPEAFGGMDGSFLELALFMEEAGRNIVPMPYFATIALCALPLIDFGTDDQKKAYLPGIAEKGDIWTLAQTEKNADGEPSEIELTAVADGADYLLNGVKLFVPYANSARRMLVVARTAAESDAPTDGISVFIVDAKSPGISVTTIPTVAGDDRCEVVFRDVRVSRSDMLGAPGNGWDIVDAIHQKAAVLKAAEMSGGARAVFQIALDYAKERKQFNRPIGSFQAVQFRLVDLLTQVDGLKYLVYDAAWHISEGTPSRFLNSAAKARANDVYHAVCYHGMVLHGAIGWTAEMNIGLYHLRTRGLIADSGATDLHREKIACELEAYEPDFVKLYGATA